MERWKVAVWSALGWRLGVAVALGALALFVAVLVGGQTTPALGQAPGAPKVRSEHVTLRLMDRGEEWTVSINVFVGDPGDGSFNQRAAAARKDVIGRFKGAVELNESTSGYVLSGYRWQNSTVSWAYNAAGKPAGLTGDHIAIQGAAAVWTNAQANFSFTGGGTTTAGTGACGTNSSGRDGLNTVGWKAQSGSILAVTCTWYTTSGSAVEFDAEIAPGWSWTTGSSVNIDLKTVMAHEFGHALGIGHSSGPCPGVLMCPTYYSGTTQHTLHSDDLEALFTLYGSALPIRTKVPQVANDEAR